MCPERRWLLTASCLLAGLLAATAGCGGNSAADAVRDGATGYYRALVRGDSDAVCERSTPRARRSLADLAQLQRLASGADPRLAARAGCADVRLPPASRVRIVAVHMRGERALVRVVGTARHEGAFRRQGDAWRYDGTYAAQHPFPPVPTACLQSWNDPANAAARGQMLPAAVRLPAAGLLDQRGGCRLRVRGGQGEATFASTPAAGWSETSRGLPSGTREDFNVRVFANGMLQPLADVAAGKPEPQAPAEPQAQPPAAAPAPPAAAPAVPAAAPGPWQDCGRIRSPFNHRSMRVEARTFDCRAGRRVAVRYLRDGALPYGWKPTDCAASRPACEQGGWGFRVVK